MSILKEIEKDNKRRQKYARDQRAAKKAREKAAIRAKENSKRAELARGRSTKEAKTATPNQKVIQQPAIPRFNSRAGNPTQAYQGANLPPQFSIGTAPPPTNPSLTSMLSRLGNWGGSKIMGFGTWGGKILQDAGLGPNQNSRSRAITPVGNNLAPGAPVPGIPDALRRPTQTTSSLPGLPSIDLDIDSLLAAQFDPQVAALRDQEGSLRRQHGISDDAIKRMYLEMAGDIKNAGTGLAANYDTAIRDVGTANDAAQASVANNYDANAAQQEAMMRRLGIEAAASDVLTPGTQNQAFTNSLIEMGQQGTQNMLRSQKAGSLAYNTANEMNAREGGAAERANLAMQFNKLLGDIGLQRAGIAADRGKTATDLSLGLYDRQYNAYNDAMNRQETLAAAEAEAAQNASKTAQERMTPWEQGYETAFRLTGNDAKAQQLMDFVRTQAYNMPKVAGVKMTPSDFAKYVNSQNRQGSGLDSRMLTELALLVYPSLYG